MECPRKFYYSMHLGRRRSGPTRAALAYGTAWHAGLEAHYKTGGDREAVLRAIIMAWQPHDNPDDHRTLERCLREYDNYVAKYGSYEEELRLWGKTVGYPDAPVVEVPTEISWPGALHPYAGKIDRIVEHNGLYLVEDHKTTSALGAYYFKQFDPSNQMMGYAWLAQKLTQLPIAGVRINAHAVLKASSKFERQTIHFSQDRLEEWAANYNSWIQRIEGALRDLQLSLELAEGVTRNEDLLAAFPHNFNACAGKYGQCTYTEVCTFPARIRSKVLEADFEFSPWDPMALDDGEEA